MIKKSVKIKLSGGLEARPIAVLVQVASQYESKVYLETSDKKVNAKSIMGMMSLGLNNGEEVTVVCDGTDEGVAVEEIDKFLSGEAS
ncbi:MAG: HPr family phosphocarrier protein [Lachnospiraceae bacterium]|nr:HPr family phosphocarrier protein [Lachnospiraceae bacterium]